MCVSPLNHDLVHRNGEMSLAGKLLLDRLHDVVRHERLAIVFANMPIRHETGFAAEIAGKLPAVIVLDDDGVPRVFQKFNNRLPVQRYEPANLQLIGGDAFVIEDLAGLFDDAFRGAPANQRHVGIARALYRDRAVLQLDEATSALDEASETELMEALGGLRGRYTVILIAHGPRLARSC